MCARCMWRFCTKTATAFATRQMGRSPAKMIWRLNGEDPRRWLPLHGWCIDHCSAFLTRRDACAYLTTLCVRSCRGSCHFLCMSGFLEWSSVWAWILSCLIFPLSKIFRTSRNLKSIILFLDLFIIFTFVGNPLYNPSQCQVIIDFMEWNAGQSVLGPILTEQLLEKARLNVKAWAL